ncbi:MAG TPA: competence/damage-inducible protein A [Bacteroidetes bacterium]|nr:competence/damage-inducible protein A [Bacteroidota bacterium]HRR07072.1 competence/damage-inducible protein A [Rhodothermales bacterium]
MKAHLITVGDEILIGQINNTNVAWIATELNQIGIDVVRMVTVGDTPADIHDALRTAFSEAELVLTTGGLGPTHDDLTKQAIASFFDKDLEYQPPIFEHIRQLLESRGRKTSELNRVQALVPQGFEVVPNPMGTAPGLWYEFEQGGKMRYLGMMPGVPFEMKAIMEQSLLPRLAAHAKEVIIHKTLLTVGIGESDLAEKIGEVSIFLGEGATLAFLPGPKTGVKLRISVRSETSTKADMVLEKAMTHIWDRVGHYIYGEGNTLPEIVVGELLRKLEKTIATAESCTGGHIADRLSDIPGSSAYLLGGVVAYCNSVKMNLLGVSEADLSHHGAVSEAVVKQMAEGIRTMTGADIGISTSGVAGPDGGTPDKPVGTIWIALADANGTEAKKLRLFKDRILNKEFTTTLALDLVRKRLNLLARSVTS